VQVFRLAAAIAAQGSGGQNTKPNRKKIAMNRTTRTILTAGASTAVLGAMALPASAAPKPHLRSVTATTLLENRGDSGGSGQDWATDKLIRSLHVTQTGGKAGAFTFTAAVSDSGSFTTIAGAATPNQGAPFTGKVIAHVVSGTFKGGATYTFTASRLPRENLVPTQESGTPSSGPRTTSLWYEQAFPAGTTFGGPGIDNDWGWAYTGPSCNIHVPGGVVSVHEAWADTAVNGDGQLPADGNIDGLCPAI
jgi:hypothetical protein